jgi:hypothetical protein
VRLFVFRLSQRKHRIFEVPCSQQVVYLMPLRSASAFLASPDTEALESNYQECRAALVSAKSSRGVLKAEKIRQWVEVL